MEEQGDRHRHKRFKASPSETSHAQPRYRPADADIHGGPISPELSRIPSMATFFAADANATIQGGQCINHHGNVTTIHYNLSNPSNPLVKAQNKPLIQGSRNRRGSRQARKGKNATTRQQHYLSHPPVDFSMGNTPFYATAQDIAESSSTKDASPEAAITNSFQRSNKIYECYLKRKDRGYPLWMPQPGMDFPIPYRIKGVSIGDVGIINPYGGFDFLFNICLPHDNPINPPALPVGFVPIHPSLGPIDISRVREFTTGSFLTASSVTMSYYDKKSPASGLNFECSDPEGAILTIPDGAYHEELVNVSRFKRYMADHLENWYKFVNGPLGREAKNGDIRLVVGCDKTTTWGMAVFSNPPQTTSRLAFRLNEQHRMGSGSKHVWEHSTIVGEVRVGPDDDESDELEAIPERPLRNQCLFVRTLNVLLADHIWAKIEAGLLATGEERSDSDYNTGSDYATQSRGSGRGGSSSTSFHGSQDSRYGNQPADQLAVGEDDSLLDSTHHFFRETEFTPSPSIIHPSKILNKFLLLQKPDAIMAMTQDRDWYSLQDAVFQDSSMLLQRVQMLNDVCEDNGIIYLSPKRREQKNIDQENAQISKLRLDLVNGHASLLVYLFGHLHGEMQLQLSKNIEVLDNHISSSPHLLECRVPLSPPGNPDRLLILDDLLRLLREEFVYEDVQEESIPSLWNQLNSLVMKDANQIGIQCLLRLGNVLQRRYSRLNLADDLEDAIHCYSQAASLSLPSKSHYHYLDANLGLACSIHQRYIAKGHLEDLIILKSTLEQQKEFNIGVMLQPLEDQLSKSKGCGTIEEPKQLEGELPSSHLPHIRFSKENLKSPPQRNSLGDVIDRDSEQDLDFITGIFVVPPSPPDNLDILHEPSTLPPFPQLPSYDGSYPYPPFFQPSEVGYTEDIDFNLLHDSTAPVNEHGLSEYNVPEKAGPLLMFEADYSPNDVSYPSPNPSCVGDELDPSLDQAYQQQFLHPNIASQQQPSGSQQPPPIIRSLSLGRGHFRRASSGTRFYPSPDASPRVRARLTFPPSTAPGQTEAPPTPSQKPTEHQDGSPPTAA